MENLPSYLAARCAPHTSHTSLALPGSPYTSRTNTYICAVHVGQLRFGGAADLRVAVGGRGDAWGGGQARRSRRREGGFWGGGGKAGRRMRREGKANHTRQQSQAAHRQPFIPFIPFIPGRQAAPSSYLAGDCSWEGGRQSQAGKSPLIVPGRGLQLGGSTRPWWRRRNLQGEGRGGE